MGQIWTRPAEPRASTGHRHRRSHGKGNRLSRVQVDQIYEGSDDEDSDIPEFRQPRSTLSKRKSIPLSDISGNSQRFPDIAAAAAATATTRAQDQKKRAQTVHPRRLREETKARKGDVRKSKQGPNINIEVQTQSQARRNTRTNARNTTRRTSPSPRHNRMRPNRYDDYTSPTYESQSQSQPRPSSSSSTILPSTKECLVCTSTRSARHFPTRPPTSTCTHPPNTCTRCLKNWITIQFTTNLWSHIACPECTQILTHADVRAFSSRTTFRRYDTLSTRAALEAIPGFAWCMAKGCSSGQVHDEGASNPKFKCVACRAAFCVHHGVAWHRGETCAQYDYRTDRSIRKMEDEASRKLIGELGKKCPNEKCRWWIEKNSGCDHMTCSKCRHQFCWVCLATYKPIRDQGNHMHRADCMHYAPPG